MIFGHVLRITDTVNTGRGGIDETPDATLLADPYQGTEGIIVNGATQYRVQLKTRVIRDAGQMNNCVTTL
jgi:hypothetical protein